jgi:hypothetical protein
VKNRHADWHADFVLRNRGASPKAPVLFKNKSTLTAKTGIQTKSLFLFRIWNKDVFALKTGAVTADGNAGPSTSP